MKTKHKFPLTILIALILNIIWEFSHYQLYIDLSGIPSTLHLIQASFTDMLIISVIFIAISLKNKNLKWINKPNKTDYLIIIVLSLIVAISIESWALSINRWQYKPLMPTIFNLGLSPLIQLFTTAILSISITRLIKN